MHATLFQETRLDTRDAIVDIEIALKGVFSPNPSFLRTCPARPIRAHTCSGITRRLYGWLGASGTQDSRAPRLWQSSRQWRAHCRPNHVVNGGMQTFPAAPGVHPGVQPGVSESHGPTTAPTPRTAPPTSECPWGYPWGAPPAAAKKPPRAKKTNHCASGTPTPCTNSTSAPSPRHPHATPSRRLRAAQPLPDQLRPALLQGAAA